MMTGAQAVSIPRSVAKPSAYAWVILTVLYIASVASALNQFKVPPVLPVLIRAFNLSLSNAGMLMSIFSFTGFLLALPAGFIMQRLGLKATGLIAVGSVFIGSGLGSFCSTANSMLASRFIEGAGIGLITIVAPAAISIWFPAEMRGTPLGLWTTCMPVGNILMFNLAPWLAELAGWQFVWKAGAVFSLAAFILFWGFFRMPKPEEAGGKPLSSDAETEHEKPHSYGKAMANTGLWLITLQFLCYNLICLALGTYYATFLNSVRNYTLSAASFTFSLCTIAAVFSQPIGGYLSDRMRIRRPLIIISSILMAPICFLPFIVTGWMIPVLIIGLGVVSGTIVPATFAAIPEVMASRQSAGLGMAVLALGQNLGMFIGPIMFGKLAESVGWAGAGYALIPVCATGVIAVCLAKFR
jgi:MFS family permease